MRAVIICGGEIESYDNVRAHIKSSDMIICADSGYMHAKNMGVIADIVLGDFDSYEKDKIECDKIKSYPVKKDFTDSEIALEYAAECGVEEVLLLAAVGGRVDHTLGNIYLLKTATEKNMRASIFDGKSTLYYVRDKIHICGKVGDLLSIIPFSKADDITTDGLEYALFHKPLPSTGISNVFIENEVEVEIGFGEAIIVHTPTDNL